MSWRCPTCRGRKAVVAFDDDRPPTAHCVECAWHQAIHWDPYDGRPERCIAPKVLPGTSTNHGRCTRDAVLNGMCWQHANKADGWDIIYARLRNSGLTEAPEAYREIFIRACQDAQILACDTARPHEVDELINRVTAIRSRQDAKRRPSIIYFVRREGLIKIGTTTQLAKRVKAISRGSCMPNGMTIGPVEVLATMPGDRNIEEHLHRRFAEVRFQGEWFHETPELLALVARLQRRAAQQENAA